MLPLIIFQLLFLPITLILSIEPGEPFPESAIPKVFSVSIQATESKYRETTLAKEYFDGPNKRGSIITWTNNKKYQTTFKRRKDDLIDYFTIEDDKTCSDQQTHNNENLFLNGDIIMTTAYYFSLLPDWKLLEKDVSHMGIKAQVYGTAGKLGEDDADFEMYWSAEDDKWQFPNCPDINACSKWWVPLKTVVEIPREDNKTEVLTYLYYDYKNVIDDPEAFQLPRGVACHLLEKTKPFPTNLPQHFEAGVEIYNTLLESQVTIKERIYYNMENDIIRDDFDSPPEVEESEDSGIDRKIWDYKNNVVYEMNSQNGSCRIINMDDNDKTLGTKKKNSIGILNSLLNEKTLNPTEFLYVGVRKYRNVDCDVWIVNITDMPTEIYMFNETAITEEGIESPYSVPIFVNTSNEMFHAAFSFFNYDLSTPHWSRFDTTSCFEEELKTRFQIELKGEYTGVIDQNMNSFILQMQKQLAGNAKILPHRFQEIMIYHVQPPNQTSTVLFTTTLVENPFNAAKVGNNKDDEAKIQQVYGQLAEDIFTDLVKPQYKFQVGSKTYLYTAVSIRDDIVSFETTNKSDSIGLYFTEEGQVTISKGADFTTSGISRIECYDNCVDSLSFECRTWSYCKDTGACALSSYTIPEASNSTIKLDNNPNCELYTRNFIQDYVLNKETVTAAQKNEEKAVFVTNSDSECAQKCSTDDLGFYCEGFDICQEGDVLTCYFRGLHILEMKSDDIKKSLTCNHYTRDYLGDFIKFKDQSSSIEGTDVVMAIETDVKDCARLCTTSADVNACKAFEICSPGGVVGRPRTQCRIFDSTKAGPRELYTDPTCDHYTRNHFIPGGNKPLGPDDRKTTTTTPGPVPNVAENKASNKPYSGGDMAGLAFGMIFLGFVLGGLVVIGIMKYKVLQK